MIARDRIWWALLQLTADECIGDGDIIQVAADLTIETDVERIVQKTIEHYKQLDVLVSKCCQPLRVGTYCLLCLLEIVDRN